MSRERSNPLITRKKHQSKSFISRVRWCAYIVAMGVWLAGVTPSTAQSLGLSGGDCITNSDCDDHNACTTDLCAANTCSNVADPGCVPCDVGAKCPPLDVVFVIDTSGSMQDEADALCSGIKDILNELAAQNIDVTATILGITETPLAFSCLTGNVFTLLGGDVPGSGATCPFPDGLSSFESWGPATAIVAERFSWTAGSVRLIVPISDEGPCNGSKPDGCADPGDDRDAITNAASVAIANGVAVSPITGSGSDACVRGLAGDLASQTGGATVQSNDAPTDLINAVARLVFDACVKADDCDDLDPCTQDDVCGGGICTGTPIPDCLSCTDAGDCDDANGCSTDTCEANVCAYALDPACTPCLLSSDCDDGDGCTDDTCINEACTFSTNFDESRYCCNPDGGALVEIDDNDSCTQDTCDAGTGDVGHTPTAKGTPCNDGLFCTTTDTCDGLGQCSGSEISSIMCDSDDDCSGLHCNTDTGFCECNEQPTLCFTPQPGILSGEDCYEPNEELTVTIDLGANAHVITGGQFLIEYDPTVLEFIDAAPGAFWDASSPFILELSQNSNPQSGTVFYAVGIGIGDVGTAGPAVIATLHFRAIGACDSSTICSIQGIGPETTSLTNDLGAFVAYETCCIAGIQINGGGPTLVCPDSIQVNADPGMVTAEVFWDEISADDGCSDMAQMECTATNSFGADIDHLIASGGELPSGNSSFECHAVDFCGSTDSCAWTVDVAFENTVELDVQLSPNMFSGPLTRCIEFEFFNNCFQPTHVVSQAAVFGLPFDLPGRSDAIRLTIPPGDYVCVTARDPLHTLRGVAQMVEVDGIWQAQFAGDPTFGGNWLVGGNIDGNGAIDIIDFGIFLEQFLTAADQHTPCGAIGPIADINGDGIVDQIDLTFIQLNFLRTDLDACCPTAGISAIIDDLAVGSISVEELRERGMSRLIVADINRDGVLDQADMQAFTEGKMARKRPKTTRRLRSASR